MNTIRANGIDIRYDIAADGPWLLLAHSLATDLTLWDDQMPMLTRRFKVMRFDLRGHGGSSAPDIPYDFGMLTADVLGLMDALGIERCSFMGISLGGMISQCLALAAPERIDRLVLVSTTSAYPPAAKAIWAERIAAVRASGMEPLVAPTLERWFTPPYREAHPNVMARIGNLVRTTPATGYIGCGHAIPTLDITARLREIRCPTLVIAGSEDAGTPPAMGKTIADQVPGARFELIPSASHLCNVERANVFNGLLAEYLS
jgi:3-oxoadipate enol-lactonase